MSASANIGPAVPAEKRGGLSKMMSRMKTVLKRSSGGSKRNSISASQPTTAPAIADSSVSNNVTKPAEPTPTPVAEPAPVETLATDTTPRPTRIMRSQIEAERAQKLAERFAITIEPLSTGPDREAFRIDKPIRMRIHRSCHRCNTAFGVNKTCTQCQHLRCKQCPRSPLKKTEKKDKGPAVAPVIDIEPDTYWGLREEMVLTRPSHKAGGQPLVMKKPKQRVRRTCHECNTLFNGGSKVCAGCQHVRCVDCPRDPAKKKHFPDGYPGDAPSSNTSRPIKYACHKCTKVFPPIPHPESPEGIARREENVEPLACVRCKHAMCSDCPRAVPTKVEPAPDPEVLKSVQAKLAALSISRPVEA